MEIGMVKIVHCSDLHFDSPFGGMSAGVAEIRRAEQFAAFEKVIDMTSTFGADLLLLPGDLFENDYVSHRTSAFFQKCFEKIKNTYVFIAPGNHDFIDGNAIYKGSVLGENVFVFSDSVSFIELKDKKCRVYGYGFKTAVCPHPCFDGFEAKDDEFVNIGVFHCALPPYTDHNPVTREQIAASGLDYLAAGHIHTHEGFSKAGKTTYAYCGIPEGRHFDETGEKGIIMGEVSKSGANLKFVPVSKRQTHKVSLDISGCLTYSDIEALTEDYKKDDLYSITLEGTLNENAFFDVKTLENILSEKLFYVKISDKSQKKRDIEYGIMETEFIKALDEMELEPDIAKMALEAGLDALFEGRTVDVL